MHRTAPYKTLAECLQLFNFQFTITHTYTYREGFGGYHSKDPGHLPPARLAHKAGLSEPNQDLPSLWTSPGSDSVRKLTSAHHINKQNYESCNDVFVNLAIPEPIQYRLWGNEILIVFM